MPLKTCFKAMSKMATTNVFDIENRKYFLQRLWFQYMIEIRIADLGFKWLEL